MTALRAKPPNGRNEKRLKLMMFSEAGVGKTIASLQMPRSDSKLYVILNLYINRHTAPNVNVF